MSAEDKAAAERMHRAVAARLYPTDQEVERQDNKASEALTWQEQEQAIVDWQRAVLIKQLKDQLRRALDLAEVFSARID